MERMEREMRRLQADLARLREEMKELRRAEMKELREIAKSCFNAATEQVQEQAKDFFKSMDRDRDGSVNLREFLAFMSEERYMQMRNNDFFRTLDTDGRGSLAFMDVITLYYIIKSGRPFCSWCNEFIPATFFSCLTCFNRQRKKFIICRSCHNRGNHNHKHEGLPALFLDNYTLLQAADQSRSRPPDQSLSRRRESNRQPTPHNGAIVLAPQPQSQSRPPDRSLRRRRESNRQPTPHNGAIVPVPQPQALERTTASFRKLEDMINVASFFVSAANLVAAASSTCTIM